MKALIGTEETITREDARKLRENLTSEFLFYLHEIVEESTDDDEEISNVMVNMTRKLGGIIEASKLEGMLEDVEGYLDGLRKYTPEVRIEEISDDE